MKRYTFLFLVLILGFSMSLWTSCSDDDGGKDDPTPPEQPSDSTDVTVAKDTTWLITKFNIGTDDFNGIQEVNLTLDNTTKKISKITSAYVDDATYVTTYTMTYTEGKITVACEGGDYTDQIIYTLNDKGFVTEADGGEDVGVFTFSYNDQGLLSEINMEGEPFFTVEYDDNKNWKGFSLGEDMTDAVVKASSLKNTCYNMDFNILLLSQQMEMDIFSVAAYLGLFPSSPNVIAGFDVMGIEVEVHSEMATDGSIESLVADAESEGMEFNTITIVSSEMQVTDKE